MNGACQAFGWVFLCGIVEIFTLTLLRVGGLRNIISASFLFALGVVPLLTHALKYEGIGIVNFMWNVMTTISMFAIGIYMFKEKVQNLQLVGAGISLVGLALILLAPEE
jgi:multidrug transporter EmrE-like cation transporter